MTKEYKPYTYYIAWTTQNKWYYGVEYAEITKIANPANLWTEYFTSSKTVKAFREEYGEPDIIQVRRVFTNAVDAVLWETKVLNRLDAKNHPNSLNGHNSDGLQYKSKYVSQETREKLSKALSGLKRSDENRQNSSIARKAYYDSPEGIAWKQMLSDKFKTNNPSPILRGADPWNKGKVCPTISEGMKNSQAFKEVWTEERRENRAEITRQKWAEGLYDNRPKLSEETKKKIGLAQKGKVKSQETRKKLSEAHKGKPKSEEAKQRMREAKLLKQQTIRTCEHCGYTGPNSSAFARYHGDKCKHNPVNQ